jgi:uncharacterized RDD family membrane protein YckC
VQSPPLWALFLAALLLYGAFLESRRSGATIGKRVFDLRVVRESGDRIGFLAAIGRNLTKPLSVVLAGIGVVMIMFGRTKQGIHDRIAGTYVLKDQS